ncbi:MAG: hypothetical protein KF832_31415 [Caldilineaceae bacterium]|nr:hypothetical protein [Caldilineaceae bacterium]
MSILIQYIANYAPWIYFVCGVIALYQLYRTWLVRAERRQAVFSLEREKAVRDLGNIFSTAMLLLLAMGITYFTSTTLVKALEPLVQEAYAPSPSINLDFIPTPVITPTPSLTQTTALVATPTPAPTNGGEPEATPTAEPTVAPAFEEPTPEPPTATAAPIVQSPACPDPRSVILRPGNNETVRGNISMVGTAMHESFQYYKIEYAAAGSNSFAYLIGDQNPVVNGFLADINTSTLGNGAWTLRLVVVDQTGNFPEPCQVTILVSN